MEGNGTVDRITSDICTLIECNLSPYCDCYFLAAPISDAVRKCLHDCRVPAGVSAEAQRGMAKIILFAVEAVLASYRIGEDWIEHLSGEVERTVADALRAVPRASVAARV